MHFLYCLCTCFSHCYNKRDEVREAHFFKAYIFYILQFKKQTIVVFHNYIRAAFFGFRAKGIRAVMRRFIVCFFSNYRNAYSNKRI